MKKYSGILLFISYWIGIRCLIQILFSYCFLLIYSVFKLVQSTKTQYLSHQNELSGRALKFWISKVQYFGQSNLYLFRFSSFYKYIFMEPFKYRSPYGYGHYNRHITTNIFLETGLFYSCLHRNVKNGM